jgi:hypothetical protein
MPNLEKLLLKSFTSISSFHICTVDAAGCGGTVISKKKLKNRFLQFTRQFILAVYFFFCTGKRILFERPGWRGRRAWAYHRMLNGSTTLELREKLSSLL